MRIHQLEVTAFGPFSGSQRIDFDDLTDAGLFLLCGPTGAGKTSVLDAICFGLYGEVPGDRNSAKRLRSDHAAAGVAPKVVLEVSINGRRFRLRRSPAWQRPKRRGTGTTTEQARVVLEEHRDDGWLHLSSRLDETGHLVTDLLGMNVTQFTQVAMLPQGRFQSFLRARSEERHKVLQQLFRTSRFEDIERWLVSHRQSLKVADKGRQDAVAAVVSRLCEAASTDLPESWELHELAAPAESGALAEWAAELVTTAGSVRDAVGGELDEVSAHARSAREELEQARGTLDLRRRHDEAVRAQQTLADAEREAADARKRLDAARRAAVVVPLARVAGEAEAAAEQAERAVSDVLEEAAKLLDTELATLTAQRLAGAERDAHEAASIAKALLPREDELKRARQRLARAEALLDDLDTEARELRERCAALPARITTLRADLAEQESLLAQAEPLRRDEQEAVARLDTARRSLAMASELSAARESLSARVDAAQALRERMHEIRESRINGMAAELAAALGSGDSCPVCGSAEHPAVASPVAGAPAQADEEAARTAYEDADFVRQTQAEAVATIERNLAVAEQSAGGRSVADLEAALKGLRDRLEACRAAGAARERLAQQVASREKELEQVRSRSEQVQVNLAALRQESTHARATVETASVELAALFEDGEVARGVAHLIESRSAAGAAFARAREALQDRDTALARSAEARQQAHDCAAEHHFDTVQAATAAALSDHDVEALEALLRTRSDLRAHADAVLSDPKVHAAAAAPAPDLVVVTAAAADAEEALAECGARSRVSSTRAERLARLEAELTTGLEAWAPTRSAYAVARTVSTFAEGKGGDNTLQMRLSAYVLASRLKQVVAAANERLRTMSDERYTLEHSASRGVGELRGGLSLQVRDEWTGESRDPATLSGGETFVASLALALGLADVVTSEAGGSSIDTLFIDEGFGTLDPETLDDVMNTLDGLRDGGRVVGIVSHVPEMRTRVTAQLQIRKDRTGSRVVAVRETV
ncbi:MAG TPA: AAA family ATPase [Nocardioidaceae bacterium]|nr:AAA family ATPase [Nocardioidaceae bacterium]